MKAKQKGGIAIRYRYMTKCANTLFERHLQKLEYFSAVTKTSYYSLTCPVERAFVAGLKNLHNACEELCLVPLNVFTM
ncbi:hypothetical protein CEXT_280901 [Caerostris extrusa]|uniref:Uncharacterized protein n=1 Tax=Caerostris extrusa TaxID=172846 RepID=A0AAV4PCF9_CAEEX|nr:hypothetical protein CEXT_280901 [Caerostris extrusa]